MRTRLPFGNGFGYEAGRAVSSLRVGLALRAGWGDCGAYGALRASPGDDHPDFRARHPCRLPRGVDGEGRTDYKGG